MQKSRVDSLVLRFVFLPPVTGSVSQALQSAITGIHNLALLIRHTVMNLPFCLSLDLELSAGNLYLMLASSLSLFRTLLKSSL